MSSAPTSPSPHFSRNPQTRTLASRVSGAHGPVERITGIIERVTFHGGQQGFSVLRLKVRGHRDLVTVVGNLAAVNAGETLECTGNWVQSPEYGLQFRASEARCIPPSSLEGIEKYLASGLIRGIGSHFAKLLVERFGEKVFDVIENSPKRLLEVKGIGASRYERITAAWKDQKVIRGIMVFLQSHGVSGSRAVRIYKTYGEEAVEKVRQNPYQLARDVIGIGFKTADALAAKLGIPKESALRAEAGLQYVLMKKTEEGHCAFPAQKLLEIAVTELEIPLATLGLALQVGLKRGDLISARLESIGLDSEEVIFGRFLYQAEVNIAQRISSMVCSRPPWGHLEAAKAIAWAESFQSISLATHQREALARTLDSKLSIITGGPGTGKSTLTRTLVQILEAKKQRIALCSPTGKAAKRLQECTGREAKTIHRLLGYGPATAEWRFLHNAQNPLPIDVLLVDEASMIDIQLMDSLTQALPAHAALILLGDVDQLPSVGPGQVLRDLIESERVPTTRLTEVFRQASHSRIIQTAHLINAGKMPNLDPDPGAGQSRSQANDFYFLETPEPSQAVAKILEIVRARIPLRFGLNPCREVQVLCPMHRGEAGARNLNLELQKALTPMISNHSRATDGVANPPACKPIERFGYTYQTGDKVIVIRNEYTKDIYNGDTGFIHQLDPEERQVVVKFDDREVCFDFDELDLLQPAYAITVHKSQGSEYPAVVIPLLTQHYPMLRRNLVYTALTRGKRLVIIVGQKRALQIALSRSREDRRISGLKARLAASNQAPTEKTQRVL